MVEKFQFIISKLLQFIADEKYDFSEQFNENSIDNAGISQALNTAFLINLAGGNSPGIQKSGKFSCPDDRYARMDGYSLVLPERNRSDKKRNRNGM